MKTRRLVLFFSIILCLCMLVACSAEVAEQKAEEQLAYATFKNDAKDFSISYDGYKSFDDLYWYYKANKLDAYGKSGDTGTLYAKVPGNSQTGGKGLDGKTEALSEGKWQFTLMAFATELDETSTGSKRYDAASSAASAIYSGSTPGASEEGIIVIRRNQTNYIPVTVTPVAGTGHIKFGDTESEPPKTAYYEWEAAGSVNNPNVKITITIPVSTTEYVITKELSYSSSNYPISGYIWLATNGTTGTIADSKPEGDYTNDFPAGVYAASIEITPVGNDDNIIFADQNLSLKVFGGLTATISGSLKELLSLDNYFAVPEVDVKVFNPDPTSETGTTITSEYVAKDDKATNDKTTVTFPADALTSTNQHSLEIEVFSAAISESKFEATSGSQAVAGLDLTLKKVTRTSEGAVTEETVEEFENSKYATIVTYINPGLEDVVVKYNGTGKDQPIASDDAVTNVAAILDNDKQAAGKLGYNSESGYLSFKTNHFSEYYVEATVYVQNVTTGKYYHSLRAAIDDAQENQTIKLLKETETGSSYTIGQPFYVKTKGLTLDLNQKSLTVTNNFSFVIEADDVTVKNGAVVSGSNTAKKSGINSYVIVVNNCKNALLDGLTVTGGVSAGGSTGQTPNCGAARNMVMMNCIVTGGDYYAVCSQNYSDVTIQSGTYSETESASGDKGVLQGHFVGLDGPEGGIIVIGGRFNGKIDAENTSNEIVLKGGIFDHDPSAYVAEGYVVEQDGDWYIVGLPLPEAMIGDIGYTLAEAIEVVEEGETIVLQKNIKATSGYIFNKDVKATMDLNGKKISNANESIVTLFTISAGNLTMTNGSLENIVSQSSDKTIYALKIVNASSDELSDLNIAVTGTGLCLDHAVVGTLESNNIMAYVATLQSGYFNTDSFDAIYLTSNSSITEIKSGTYQSVVPQAGLEASRSSKSYNASYPIYIDSGAIVTISGGEFVSSSPSSGYGFYIKESGSIGTISGGYFRFADYIITESCRLILDSSKIGSITGGKFMSGTAVPSVFDLLNGTGPDAVTFRGKISNDKQLVLLDESFTSHAYFSTSERDYTHKIYEVVNSNT